MPDVRYDDRSFLVDGKRIWLVSGAVHYFRIPSDQWRESLLKVRRGGLNCISTYVAWNYHEPMEGRWDLSGDRDVVSFVRMAGDLGLYVILRPGPYISADWDFGGLPSWLTTKTGVVYRSSSAAYSHYFDKYFRNVLPRLAEHQVTRGGNIILIQNENAYYMTTMPDRLSHLEFISQLFRRSGFDIPIITCNQLSEPPLPDSIEAATGGEDIVQQLKQLRYHQPEKPMLAIELYTGGPDAWGREHRSEDPRTVARRAMETLGCGAQVNYYVYHGGTNFGFRAGRLGSGPGQYCTTSYDYDAPISEGGGLTEKYYVTRPVNMLAEYMGRFLAGCRGGPGPCTVLDSTAALNLEGPEGSWVFLSNNGREDIPTVRVSLPMGDELTVPLGDVGAAAVPYHLAVAPGVGLDYANLTPLGLFGEDVLVFHGPAGWEARISINERELRAEVPGGEDVVVCEHEEMRIVLVRTELARRTWFVEDTLVFGPAFVGETLEDIIPQPGAKQYMLLPLEGKPTTRRVTNGKEPIPAPPKVKPWKRIAVCVEPVSDELEWRRIDRPTDVDHLGFPEGYHWLRLVWEEPRARKRALFLPGCEDRATLFVNGEFLGIWGRGADAVREPLGASLRRGRNTLTMLMDNLGRCCSGWRLGEPKGLFEPVYEAKSMSVRMPKPKPMEKFPRRVVPRGLSHLLGPLERMPAWSVDVDISLSAISPVHMSFDGLSHHVAVLCNDRSVGFFPCEGVNYGDLTLAAGLKKGKNQLRLLLWGEDVEPESTGKFRFHSLFAPIGPDGRWEVRPWERPTPGGPVVGKDQPAWYATQFAWQPGGPPLFLHVAGARKGQILLNGRNVGRFWTVGPQDYYYLPACWLEEQNELLLFVEQGNLPRRTRLEYRPQGPYRP